MPEVLLPAGTLWAVPGITVWSTGLGQVFLLCYKNSKQFQPSIFREIEQSTAMEKRTK